MQERLMIGLNAPLNLIKKSKSDSALKSKQKLKTTVSNGNPSRSSDGLGEI